MNALVRYDAACQALAAARSVDEVKEILDLAVAAAAYARQAKNKNLEADAGEIRLRATRCLGQMMRGQKETIGLNRGMVGSSVSGVSKTPVKDDRPTLAEQGVDKNLAKQARALDAQTDAIFAKTIANARDAISRAVKTVIRTATIEAEITEPTGEGCTVEDLDLLVASGKKFGVIYADPPWSFEVYSGKGKQRSADRHYNTMTLDGIKALPVASLAADDCALMVWAVLPEIPGALEVIKAWGFTYKTVAFTWVKQNKSGNGLFWGMGYWTRANAEICILATRGAPKRLAKDVHQIIMSPVSEHSRKPDEAQVRIERLLGGPYLELFGRRATPGWTVWGNQVERSLLHQDIPEFA